MPDSPLALIAKYRLRLDKQSQADLERLIAAYALMSGRIKDKADLLFLEYERAKTGVPIEKTHRYKEFVKALTEEFQKYFIYLETELEGIEAKARTQAKTDSVAAIAAALVER